MVELIAITILITSLLGMGIIVFRKIPVLAELPTQPTAGYPLQKKEGKLLLKLKEKIKTSRYFKIPPYEIFLQKILSKIRILSLKIESQTTNLLQKLREKSKEKKEKENDNYWQELKKSAKK